MQTGECLEGSVTKYQEGSVIKYHEGSVIKHREKCREKCREGSVIKLSIGECHSNLQFTTWCAVPNDIFGPWMSRILHASCRRGLTPAGL